MLLLYLIQSWYSPENPKSKKGGVASYENCEGKRLWGAVFELTNDEKLKLDSAEGYSKEGKDGKANSYTETKIEVTTINNTKIMVDTYVAIKTGAYLLLYE